MLLESKCFQRLNVVVSKKLDPADRFGRLLREHREGQSWTQEDLASELGVDRAYVSQLERGIRTPTLRTLIKLADVFSVDVTFGGVRLN